MVSHRYMSVLTSTKTRDLLWIDYVPTSSHGSYFPIFHLQASASSKIITTPTTAGTIIKTIANSCRALIVCQLF